MFKSFVQEARRLAPVVTWVLLPVASARRVPRSALARLLGQFLVRLPLMLMILAAVQYS
ncbi:hypothetical protein K227x_01230 [Rubripirellula lacrimiformis]|uniref:Uncharacterized protein n=1 Tax=Rubripirellula lacrimiformis TaxID=1930273 RepID=A0A517N3P8_9BACT|nr:hypothetical protein K227x_01230 [Rubripirellula lacrimiformis]